MLSGGKEPLFLEFSILVKLKRGGRGAHFRLSLETVLCLNRMNVRVSMTDEHISMQSESKVCGLAIICIELCTVAPVGLCVLHRCVGAFYLEEPYKGTDTL